MIRVKLATAFLLAATLSGCSKSSTSASSKEATSNATPAVDPAAAKQKSVNNLKMIGLGFFNHQDQIGVFPHDFVDKNGKPLLSWRVAILPFIEQHELFKQFKLGEAWDSDHNKKLLDRMPKLYAPPVGKFEDGQTVYQSFAGPTAVMNGKPIRNFEITDGTSNTFLVVEAGDAVPWTKPADIPFDPLKPLPKLGGLFDGDFNVLYADGSVRFIKKGVKEETLKKCITISGGEMIKNEDLKP